MKDNLFYGHLLDAVKALKKQMAILLDPDKINVKSDIRFLKFISKADYIFVGGSSVENEKTDELVTFLKKKTEQFIVLFPGNVNQISNSADAILFLSLMSGNDPEYLTGQHIKAAPLLKKTALEVIPTAYILIDGGHQSAIERVTGTKPLSQKDVELIVHTAIAAEYSGKKMVYLEAGSGAKYSVSTEIISEVKANISIPLIVGGGIRTERQQNDIYKAGADLIVMGTVFE